MVKYIVLKNSFGFLLFSLFSITLIQPVYAGGVPIAAYADTNGSANNDGLYLRVIRAYINPVIPCKDTQVTFTFNKPEDGDYIMTGSGNATYTLGERTNSGCATYAKMGSKIKGVREIEVDARNGSTQYTGYSMSVDFDGEYHEDSQIYRSSINDPFGGTSSESTSPTPTAYPVPVGTLTVRVLSHELAPMYNRNVVIKWSALESSQLGNSIFYDVYGKPANDLEWHRILSDQAGPSATLTLGREDYHLKVQGCIRKVGNCVDSNILFLPKIQEDNGIIVTTQPIQTISSVPSNNSEQVDALNKKVASLEGKLAESQKKQSVLEQTINNLLSWIKSHFPFFK